MAEDYGIKISKAGTEVTDTLTSATKKNFTILSTDSVHKVSAQAVVTSDTNIAHGLGFRPMWDAYVLTNSLARARPATDYSDYGYASYWDISCDATNLYCNETSGSEALFYIIYLTSP